MPRGGKRAGAGRKKGAATKRTQKTSKLAVKSAGAGALPLEVLLKAMRHFDAKKDYAKAAAIAGVAAPYVHPRLSSIMHAGGIAVRKEIVEELVDGDSTPDGAPSPGSAGVPPL